MSATTKTSPALLAALRIFRASGPTRRPPRIAKSTLAALTERGLVEHCGGGVYRLTSQGRRILDMNAWQQAELSL